MHTTAYDTVFVNGSVGTGKTTTAEHVGGELSRLGIPGAVVDVDELRNAWPAPSDDRFQSVLALSNLRAVSSNFRCAGAQVVIAAGVVETVDELRRYETALGGHRLLHVRLTASPESIAGRLRERHGDDASALDWHIRRHPELEAILTLADFADALLINTSGMTRGEVARDVLDAIVALHADR